MKTKEQKIITVGELIEVLKTFDPSLPAWTEGCDCWGPCSGAAQQQQRDGKENIDIVILYRS